jgi:hypothetical protein
MPIEIIKLRKEIKSVEYFLNFSCGDCFYSFPCDENGKVDESIINPYALENLRKCQSDSNVIKEGVHKVVNSWVENAVGRCHCGEEVELGHFTCTCEKCGKDYNWNGQELAPREQWGEETGERF